MERIDEIISLFSKLCNINLTTKDEIPEISSSDKVKLIKVINDAKAEVERLRILDIMNKTCK
ncbi:MAG: hypothetical protein J6S07_09285 [Bacteroidaceae bacterium]|nr:hypothetical protein [Bacteroidaceae bacterium]